MSGKPIDYIKRSVREKTIYALPDIDYKIKINQNENPYDLPAEIKQSIIRQIANRQWNRYPRLGSEGLRNTIGKWLGCESGQIMVGNGSNEILLAIMNSLLGPGQTLVTIEPTFSLYKHFGEILGADVITVPLREDFSYDLESLSEQSSKEITALTILCSPNNPTGSVIAENDLRRLLERTPGYVVMDEAYYNFADQDFLALTEEYENLIINRTFSKAFAFAFGRFGYGIASDEFVNEVYKVLLPYNLSGFTETAAEILMAHSDSMNPIIQIIKEERQWMTEQLYQVPDLKVYPSNSNFFLILPEISSDFLFSQLLERKIIVRDVSHYPGLENHLRLTVGTHEENERVVKEIKEILRHSEKLNAT